MVYFAADQAGIVFNFFLNFEQKWASCFRKSFLQKQCIAIFVNWHYLTLLYQSKQQVVLSAIRFFLAVW